MGTSLRNLVNKGDLKKMKRFFAALTLLALLISGCSRQTAQPTTEPETTQSQTETTAAPTTEPTTAPTSEATTEPPETEPPAPVYHSGLREDGSFSSGTLFIGDSETYLFLNQYLILNDLLGDAHYTAQCGSQLTVYFDESIRMLESNKQVTIFSPEFEGMTFREAAAALGEEATAIYLMWGTNFTPNATAESYVEIVDDLLQVCPNATIHLQTIPNGDTNIVAPNTVNKRITGAWEHYQEIGEPRVYLVDTFNGIGKHVVSDGVHLSATGLANWYQTLLDHAELYGLSE